MITLRLSSKRFNCFLELKEKVTFVVGISGGGKTEMTRRLSSDASSKKVEISDGYGYEILSSKRFSDFHKNALRHILSNEKIDLDTFNLKTEEVKKKAYQKYWEDELNSPFQNSIIIIDDEDFVDTIEFSSFFGSDKSNYYLIINRRQISKISYSVSEVYTFIKDGVNHYLERRYELPYQSKKEFDFIITEGVGSDYIFFRYMFGDKVINPTYRGKYESGGRSVVTSMIEANKDEFRYKNILVLIDYVAFGSNFASLLNLCDSISADFCILSSYQSFEYLLLRSNLIDDKDIQHFTDNNRLRFKSLENLYTSRLEELTKGSLLSYSKEVSKFPVCYYKDCCSNEKYRGDNCSLRKSYFRRNKFIEMLKDTEFSDLLDLIEDRKL